MLGSTNKILHRYRLMISPAQVAGAHASSAPTVAPRATPGRPPVNPAASADAAAEQEKLRRQTDGASFPVLPDCCNFGTILRVLSAVNAAMLLTVLAVSGSFVGFVDRSLNVAAIVEPSVLVSLALLCPLRRISHGTPRTVQWAIGLAVSGLVTGLIALVTAGVLVPDLRGWELLVWAGSKSLLAVAIAVALIEWLYLRTLSLQPSQAEGRLQALQARIRPHFLFNSLNTVLGLMRSEPRQAERTLENLADLFRVFMKDSRELVPLDEEVLLCKEYLSIEKLRLTDRLSVVWHVDDMPGDALLPSLLLQPLVENAVHHGIEPRSERGEVSITIAKSGERVRVDIVNPIAKQAPTRPGNQMALSNIRERMSLTFDVEGSLVTVAEGGLFRATLVFPYRKERRRRDVKHHLDTDR